MRIVYVVLLLALSCPVAAQTVWKYVDDQGIIHYTDQPVPGAQRVQLRSGNTTTAAAAPSTGTTNAPNATNGAQAYRVFQIVRPANQDSVVNTGGQLQVSMQLEPALMTGHSLSLFLDGKVVAGFAPNTLDYDISSVPRGEHTLVGVIVDENQRRIAETNKVTFNMRQKSVQMNPPVGPSVRPPAKAPTSPRAPTRGTQPSFADLNPGRTVTAAPAR